MRAIVRSFRRKTGSRATSRHFVPTATAASGSDTVKHGTPNEVRFRVEIKDSDLLAEIADDGRGLPEETPPDGSAALSSDSTLLLSLCRCLALAASYGWPRAAARAALNEMVW